MKSEVVFGVGPVCKVDKKKCSLLPGYVYSGKTGKGCIIGNKTKCMFDRETFKKTALYKKILEEKEKGNLLFSDIDEYVPQYKWFGKSPYCDVGVLDVIAEGYFPLNVKDKWGDGFYCVKGKKILGIKPFSSVQQDYIDSNKDKAIEYVTKKKKRNKFINNALKKVGNAAKKFVSSYLGVPEESFESAEKFYNSLKKKK